jgi:WD40 repeat protein
MIRANHELWLNPTENLVAHHKFYPAKIPVAHHQLRHLISVAEKNQIYYIWNRDVYLLDLETHQSSLIATVPFDSRCLAADLGWVCIGGEQNGDCAFIKVEKDEHGRPICFGHDFNHDMLGGEIVNSMSIHTILNEGKTPDEPAILISNNDKSVKLYSLVQREVLTTLHHSVPMNFATMSPDSSIIAAVGDSARVYFYKRREYHDPDIIDGSYGRYVKYEWDSLAEPQVPTGEPVYDDYSFAVTFSPSGHLCAASSQGGSISVFDMQHLLSGGETGESSILCTFRSSRSALFGCVRSMVFSPAPWDLLAWAEDHGRVGVADVRQECVRRQIVDLDRRKAEEVKLEDGTPVSYRNISHKEKIKHQHLTRLRAMRSMTSSRDVDGDLSIDDLPTEPARRYSRQDLISYRGLDLDARERSVVEALETTMEHVEQPPSRPYSINYTSSPRWFASRMPAEGTPQSPGPVRSSNSRPHHPRRRSSVVLSESTVNAGRYLDVGDGHRMRISASPGRMGDDEASPIMSTNNLTPSTSASTSQPNPSNIPPGDPWHVIQTALESARETDNSNRANLARIEAALEAERQLGTQLERQLADERQLSHLLTRQLDTQQRLLVENSNQLEHLRAAARESNARVEASLERVLQRQLAHEQHFLNQRAEELQSELRTGTDYSRRLENERDRILTSAPATSFSNPSSARTTTLPTINLRPADVTSVLSDYSESHRERLAHIENLQRQVRRAESRVALAAIDIQALENAIRREMGADEITRPRSSGGTEPRMAGTSAQATPLVAAIGNTNAREPVLINQAPVASSAVPITTNVSTRSAGATRQDESTRPTELAARSENSRRVQDPRRGSQLAGRIPEEDMRLARMMFLSGMSVNRALDANGNWMPPSAEASLQRIMNTGAASIRMTGITNDNGIDNPGIGTTGIGFSQDGQFL